MSGALDAHGYGERFHFLYSCQFKNSLFSTQVAYVACFSLIE